MDNDEFADEVKQLVGHTPEERAEWILDQMDDPDIVAELAERFGLPRTAPRDTVLDVMLRYFEFHNGGGRFGYGHRR